MKAHICPSYNGWGVTAFDALDTMLLMDLKDEYTRAVRIVEMADFNRTTVRITSTLILHPPDF